MSRRNLWIMGGAGVLVTAGAFLLLRQGGDRPAYRTAPVERGEIVATVVATGTLNPVITVQVGSQISGMVKHLSADFNSVVKRGQLIARIDPELFEARANQARASLESARAAVLNQQANRERAAADVENARAAQEAARANVARQRVAVIDAEIKLKSRTNLFREGGISQEERDSAQAAFDSARAQLDAAAAQERAAASALRAAEATFQVAGAQLKAAEANVAQQRAALAQAEVDLSHTFIRAPVDGVVISRNVDVGQTVAASLQAPVLFLIAQDLTRMQVNTSVAEADIGQVKNGQQARFTVDAYPARPFEGTVTQVRSAPNIIQNVVTYDVIIEVGNPDGRLKPGMTANVRIMVGQKADALKIPAAALRFRPSEGEVDRAAGRSADSQPERSGRRGGAEQEGKVWVLEDGTPKPVTITLGLKDGNSVEVEAGELREGQEVLVGTGPREPRAAPRRRSFGFGF
ncbi:MAG: efflux RND transporter periplasmic adaptor subunit [Candidatus Methylomirabilales bacterium]